MSRWSESRDRYDDQTPQTLREAFNMIDNAFYHLRNQGLISTLEARSIINTCGSAIAKQMSDEVAA